MNNVLKHPLFNWLLGFFFGLCFGAAFAAHGMTKRIEQANRECAQKINALLEQRRAPVGLGQSSVNVGVNGQPYQCVITSDGNAAVTIVWTGK